MMRKLLFLLPLAIVLAGCVSSEYDVSVYPSTANVTVMGNPPGEVVRTPTGLKVQLPSNTDGYTVKATLNGYADASYVIRPNSQVTGPIKLELQPLFLNKTFSVATDPAGAQVLVDDKPVGITPLASLPLTFNRKDAKSPWDTRKVTVKLNEWQSETVVVSSTDQAAVSIPLSRLHQDRTFSVKVETSDGQALDAPVTVNDKVVGNAPVSIPLVFERADKSREWPVYSCKVGIKDEYKEQSFTLTRESPDNLKIVLDPVTELGVKRMQPTVTIGPRGAQYVVDSVPRNASVDTRETSGTVAELRQVTAFRRNDHRSPEVNSFAIAPNGQTIVYALSETDDDGTVYSNLWQTATDVTSGARQRLTNGVYLDYGPQLPAGEGSQALVFQSNRGMRDSADISSIKLEDGHAVGGITQITREARFNYSPVIMRQEWELFFVSAEDHYPQAVPQISYMKMDGSAPTYMNESGCDLALTPNARQIFFVHKDSTTGKNQINSMPMEGYPLTQVISQEAFNAVNCTSPAINPEGTLMLFVSDMAQDSTGRSNNDIYLMNMATGKITPVTANISDDIAPMWSPVEPGVIYFLSNRGGCYNVWRLRLTDVQ
jgi:hypothetical protein